MTTMAAGDTRLTAYVSTINGISVAWDMCGDCHQHVSRCSCDSGPVEPPYLAAWRTTADPPVHDP